MYKSILLAVDDSEPSRRAVHAAGELAQLSGAAVHLLHVREHQDVVGKSGGSFDIEEPGEAAALIDRAREELAAFAVTPTSTVLHVGLGHVAEEIVKTAEDSGADTIVMGSHGRSSVGALVAGSDAHKVMHLTALPLLVIR